MRSRAGRRAWPAALSLIVLLALLPAEPARAAKRASPPSLDPAPFRAGEVLVKFAAGPSTQAAELPLAAYSAVTRPAPELAKLGYALLTVPDDKVLETVAALQQNPQVASVEPNYLVQATDTIPNDPDWPLQYGPANIQAPKAWDITTGTASVTIAIIDTGIDLTHPDLAAQIWTNPGETGGGKETNGLDDDGDGYVDDWRGWNYVSSTNYPQDDHGHGTHVAGIAGAVGNNSIGIAGVAWGARLMALKILDSAGNGTEADVASAIVYATDHGARVINLSLGGSFPMSMMADAVNYAYAHGVTVVAATGNTNGPVLYPAAYPNTIAVASVDSGNARSYFSNYGPEVDLAAPGSSIYSTGRGGGYLYLSGTSMATPHVSGVAALLASLPQFDTPGKIRVALQATALDLGDPGWDQYYGYGLVQAYSALNYRYHVAAGPATGFQFGRAGSVVTYTLSVTNTGILTDSFTVTVSSGIAFANAVETASTGSLAPFASAPVTVTVTVVPLALPGTTETASVTITSGGDATQQAGASLKTVVPYAYRLIFLFR